MKKEKEIKFWILRLRDDLDDRDNPLSSLKGVVQGMIVAAENESTARNLACENSEIENTPKSYHYKNDGSVCWCPWINPNLSFCFELSTSEFPDAQCILKEVRT